MPSPATLAARDGGIRLRCPAGRRRERRTGSRLANSPASARVSQVYYYPSLPLVRSQMREPGPKCSALTSSFLSNRLEPLLGSGSARRPPPGPPGPRPGGTARSRACRRRPHETEKGGSRFASNSVVLYHMSYEKKDTPASYGQRDTHFRWD